MGREMGTDKRNTKANSEVKGVVGNGGWEDSEKNRGKKEVRKRQREMWFAYVPTPMHTCCMLYVCMLHSCMHVFKYV